MRFNRIILFFFILSACASNRTAFGQLNDSSLSSLEEAYLRYLTCSDTIGSHYLTELEFNPEKAAKAAVSICREEAEMYASELRSSSDLSDINLEQLINKIEIRTITDLSQSYAKETE